MPPILVLGEQASGHLKKATLSALAAAQQLARRAAASPTPGLEPKAEALEAEAYREPDLELQQGSPEAAREAAERVRRVKTERDGNTARAALDRLAEAAAGTGNLQPRIRDAVAAYCTVGEITAVLKEKFGSYQPPTKF